jgi:anti-anti-sigma factor
MSISSENLSGTVVARPRGRIDYEASTGFQKDLELLVTQARESGSALLVSCAEVSYVSSAGLRAFLVIARAAKSAGVEFAVCALGPTVQDVFEVSGFSRLIRVLEKESDLRA